MSTQTAGVVPLRPSTPGTKVEQVATVVGLERWIDKKTVAEHYGMTVRWVEEQMLLGMPRRRLTGRTVRFRLSEVDAWLTEHYA